MPKPNLSKKLGPEYTKALKQFQSEVTLITVDDFVNQYVEDGELAIDLMRSADISMIALSDEYSTWTLVTIH